MEDKATVRRDVGRQPERTGLSWARTGLLALVAAVLSIRLGLTGADIVRMITALILASMAVMTLHRGHQRSRYTENEEVVTSASRKFLLATSVALVAASVVHAALLLSRPFR